MRRRAGMHSIGQGPRRQSRRDGLDAILDYSPAAREGGEKKHPRKPSNDSRMESRCGCVRVVCSRSQGGVQCRRRLSARDGRKGGHVGVDVLIWTNSRVASTLDHQAGPTSGSLAMTKGRLQRGNEGVLRPAEASKHHTVRRDCRVVDGARHATLPYRRRSGGGSQRAEVPFQRHSTHSNADTKSAIPFFFPSYPTHLVHTSGTCLSPDRRRQAHSPSPHQQPRTQKSAHVHAQ